MAFLALYLRKICKQRERNSGEKVIPVNVLEETLAASSCYIRKALFPRNLHTSCLFRNVTFEVLWAAATTL